MEQNNSHNNTVVAGNPATQASVNAPTYQPPVQTQAPYTQVPYNTYPIAKIPKPFYGFNIVALVLGIISLISAIGSLSDSIEILFDILKLNSNGFESLGYYVANCITGIIITALCLIFGFIGYRKKENHGRSLGLAGLICGGIGLLCYVVSFVLLAIA